MPPAETEPEKDPVVAEQPIDKNAAKRADALARCGSVYIHVSGQQSYRIWCQQIGIAYTDIPLEDAKGLVKLNSMMQGEYDCPGEYFEGGYAGLSMLANDIARYGTMLQKDIEENGAPESYGEEFEEALGRKASAFDFGRYLMFMAGQEPDLYAKYLAYLPRHHTAEERLSIDEVGDEYVDALFLHHRPIFKEHFSWCNNFDGEGTCGPNEAEGITDAEWEDRLYDGFNHLTDAGELFDPAKFSLECHSVGIIETDEGDSIVFGNDEFVGLVVSHEGF